MKKLDRPYPRGLRNRWEMKGYVGLSFPFGLGHATRTQPPELDAGQPVW